MEKKMSKEDASFVERARQHFERTLRHNLKNLDDGRLPRDADGTLHVLSVGCGLGYDAAGVLSVFPNSRYKGIDIDPNILRSAKLLNSDLSTDTVEFLQEDARIISDGERDKYGLVIIRNPQPGGTIRDIIKNLDSQGIIGRTDATQLWETIINSSIEKTRTDGYIFITTDIDSDREMIRDVLDKKNIQHWTLHNIETPPSGLVLTDSTIIISHVQKI